MTSFFNSLAWQRLDGTIRNAIPALSAILFILYSVVPWPLPSAGLITPTLGLAAVYFWSMHRPDIFGVFTVFTLGLLADTINLMPLGLSSIIFLAIQQLSLRQRRLLISQAFYVLWAGFCIVAVLAGICQWVAISLFRDIVLPVTPMLAQVTLTVVLFPLPAWIMTKLQKILPTAK